MGSVKPFIVNRVENKQNIIKFLYVYHICTLYNVHGYWTLYILYKEKDIHSYIT